MDDKQLDGMRVAILVTKNFEQVEMTEPRKALEQAGAKVDLIAPLEGKVQAFQHDEKGDLFDVDVPLDEASPQNYDALMLPGGALNADKLRMVDEARDFVRAFQNDGKAIAFICHAPWLLVSSGLVEGRVMTSYYTLQDDIRNAGGNWLNQEVVVDRNWVSSRKPDDIPAFNKAMIRLFAENKLHQRTVERGEGDILEVEDLEGDR